LTEVDLLAVERLDGDNRRVGPNFDSQVLREGGAGDQRCGEHDSDCGEGSD
jgi:hypothetical protein